jgi:CHASE2 domain-containing sensor protein/signal transduction histidine kinase
MSVANQYRGLYLSVQVALVTTLACLSGVLYDSQGRVYDQFVNLFPWVNMEETQVVIMEIEESQSVPDAAAWLQLLEKLQALGPRLVVVTGMPADVAEALAPQLMKFGNLVIGQAVKSHDLDVTELTLDELPTLFRENHAASGVMVLPTTESGIYRSAATGLEINGEWRPSLIVAAARAAGAPAAEAPGAQFLVNFNDGRDRLPKVSAARVLEDAMIPELIAGRAVLIGRAPDVYSPGFHAPNTYGTEPLSLLEFQGYALDTLLRGNRIRSIEPLWMFGILLLTGFASLLLYQGFDVIMGGILTLALLLCYWAVTWVQLHYLHMWIPVFELTLNQCLLYLVVARHKVAENDAALRKLIIDGSSRFLDTASPAHFNDSPEYWTQIITLVDQVLNLRRLIFLEKVEGDHRVREVKSLNCFIEDIDERRRDYERTPYSTAITEGGPLLLQKHYLKPLDGEEEDQYLVPLVFAGEVLGFWAFGVTPETVAVSNRFLDTVAVFASRIAELLYHRRSWHEQQRKQPHPLRALLSLQGGDKSALHVRRLLELAERRLSGLEAAFNGMDTAAIVYDMFGRVLQLNRRMEEFMRRTDLPAYDLTALELLVRLTGNDYRHARQLLREVAMENGQFHLPVTSRPGSPENFMLSVRALTGGHNHLYRKNSPDPLEVAGLLFEVINVTQLKGAYVLKDEFVERFGQRMRRELGAIVLGSDLLQEKNVSIRDRSRAARVVRDKVSIIVELFNQARRYMQVKVAGPGLGLYPVDATVPVSSAVQSLASKAEERGIHFQTRMPEVISLVNAPPQELGLLMQLLLTALLNDAAENTAIEITVEECDSTVSYRLRNSGFGIPNERFQDYLFGSHGVVAEEFKGLRDAIQYVAEWEGRVAANSEVGSGMAFDIELRAVI